MSMTKDVKIEITKDHKINKDDTGSADVQVALLTENIARVSEHLSENKKDFNSKRSLLKFVGTRRRLLEYLKRTKNDRYQALIKKLNLRK